MRLLRYLYIFMLGFSSFFISQILLRIPLLSYIGKNVDFSMMSLKYPLIIGIIVAFSAGVFEEGFRFIFRRFLIKNSYKIIEPVIFGLGHSIMEIIYIFAPVVIVSGIGIILGAAIYERALSIIFHIELTIIIWNGFAVNKRYKYLLAAICIHGFTDSLIPVFTGLNLSFKVFEIIYLIIVLITGFITIKFNKLEMKL